MATFKDLEIPEGESPILVETFPRYDSYQTALWMYKRPNGGRVFCVSFHSTIEPEIFYNDHDEPVWYEDFHDVLKLLPKRKDCV